MQTISRRQLLTTVAAVAAAPTVLGAARSGPARSTLQSDIGTLKRVLMHPVSTADSFNDRLDDGVLPDVESDLEAAARQHQGLLKLLRAAGAEVVELEHALDEAIRATRPHGVFETWLRAAFPELGADPAKVTAATVLGRDRKMHFELGADGNFRHRVNESTGTIWTRDSAVMTPRGLLICRSASVRRRRENLMLRFVYRHSPLLEQYPVVFDAVEEGMIVEGGDMMVVDRDTMFLGVGNRTDPRIAPLLAQRLDMNVLTVQTLKREYLATSRFWVEPKFYALRILLLHLDTYFTLVAPRHALTVPWLLEQEHAVDNPFTRFIRGARAETLLEEDEAKAALRMLKEFGRVKLYARGSGKAEDLGAMKLVDYLRTLDYRFTWLGGKRAANEAEAFSQFMSEAYPELRRQACNVVQAQPGRVIAYAGNPLTRAALEADGVAVDTFEARELWAWHGGPHCLTQPLERS